MPSAKSLIPAEVGERSASEVWCPSLSESSGAPPHKALRELMENQGYLYEQLYINGANTRGFKGIGLSRDRTEETFK
jgi:hypothetical protein